MPTAPVQRKSGRAPGILTPRDGVLLERFVQHQDAAAFRALVERHGPLVFGVCRRVLGNRHDAEDAFQATFFILARNAKAVKRPNLLGNWLYGVAHRVACKAQVSARRRQARERRERFRPASDAGEPGLEAAWREVRLVLDEEIARLPEKYRAPLVLCYLQARTNEEAAALLGCPAGSMSGRLNAAREKLRRRLRRRGLVLSALLLLLLRPGRGPAADLVDVTAEQAALLVAGSPTTLSPALELAGVTVASEVRAKSSLWVLLLGLFLFTGAAAAAADAYLASRPTQQFPPEPTATQPANDACLTVVTQ